jgi:hypothetical protein
MIGLLRMRIIAGVAAQLIGETQDSALRLPE